MLSTAARQQRNAHVVASVQNRHAQGAYKPLAREFLEQDVDNISLPPPPEWMPPQTWAVAQMLADRPTEQTG